MMGSKEIQKELERMNNSCGSELISKDILISFRDFSKKIQDLEKQKNSIEGIISSRVDHVLSIIHIFFGHDISGVFDDDSKEYNWQLWDLEIPDDDKGYQIGYKCEAGFNICHNNLWDYADGMPVDFIFMTDKEIRAYLQDEKERNDDMNNKEKKKKPRFAQKKRSKK